MNPNMSPWLYQLKRTRPVDIISSDLDTDVVIVGGGIAGIMTAYFTLKNTERKVTLIEGNKVAHGATGHNAGQIVAEFEREFTDLVREYGLEKAVDAEESAKSAWVLLEELYQNAKLNTPFSSFMGYNGYKSISHIIEEIKANAFRIEAGVQVYCIYVADNFEHLDQIPKEYRGLYEIVPQVDILSLLETKDTSYVAAIATKKGCVNSALLSEEIAGYLLTEYKKRFSLFEHTTVQIAELNEENAILRVSTNKKDGTPEQKYVVSAKKVVLCTNGFERIHILNKSGDDIDVKFHHMVNGDIGYMAAYVEDIKNPPTALGYYDQGESNDSGNDAYTATPYVYMTRRPYELEDNQTHNLVCIGGPEEIIAETQNYDRQGKFSEEKGKIIDDFVKKTIPREEKKDMEYKFQWHGIMCYTPTSMRVIGFEPKNKILMYNLGCNGVGIMTSIYGGSKISKLIRGDEFDDSIFDPRE
ncbi:MAG: FAD-binding oxidoreductase [Patescibacteria group bacterium]